MTAILEFRQQPGEAEAAVPDRRESAFNDPRFWVSVTAVLLTLTLFLLTLAVNKLSSIDTAVQSMRESTTRQTEEIKALREQVVELKAKDAERAKEIVSIKDRQTDYNFNLSNRLKEIEVTLKMKGN